MGLDDQLAQRQSDAATADLRRLAELEHFATVLRRHAGTRVREPQNLFLGVLAGDNVNGAAIGLRFHSVAQQVVETLA